MTLGWKVAFLLPKLPKKSPFRFYLKSDEFNIPQGYVFKIAQNMSNSWTSNCSIKVADTGFKPGFSGIGSDRTVSCATTTLDVLCDLRCCLEIKKLVFKYFLGATPIPQMPDVGVQERVGHSKEAGVGHRRGETYPGQTSSWSFFGRNLENLDFISS